jgi:SH3-like domain-containing protein
MQTDPAVSVGPPALSLRPVAMVAGLLALAAAVGLALMHRAGPAPAVLGAADVTATLDAMPVQRGPSGLPLPRFVTLKAVKVNVRKGPSHDHAIDWTYQRKGLPVEIIAESDTWRKVRDAEGQEGWIQQSMLTGKRNALVAGWVKNGGVLLHPQANAGSGDLARLAPGVVATIESCDGDWCYLSAGGYEGYALQSELWGVYPGEEVN